MDKVIIEPRMPKRQKHSLERKQSRYGYLFTLPIILGFALMYIPVIVQSLIYSFSSITYQQGKGMVTEWVGTANYETALQANDATFMSTVINSTLALIPQIFVILIFAFFMANILNQNFRGRTPARVIFFIPVIMSTGVISYFDSLGSFVDTYSKQGKLDVGSAGVSFDYSQIQEIVSSSLGSSDLANIVMAAVDGIYGIITSAGVQMLVFLSGLQSISPNMYEAAKVEGATGWEIFWKISFPMISPLILVNLMYTVIDLFLKSDNKAIAYINEALESSSRYAEASALSWIYTIVILLFVGIALLLVKKFVVYQD